MAVQMMPRMVTANPIELRRDLLDPPFPAGVMPGGLLAGGVAGVGAQPLDRIARLAAHLFTGDVLAEGSGGLAAVALADETCLWLVARTGALPPMTPLEGCPSASILGTGRPTVCSDLMAEPDFQSGLLARLGYRAYAGVPLATARGQTIGALFVAAHRIHLATPDELQRLTDLAALAMAEISLRSTSWSDPISALPNRHHLLDQIEQLASTHPGEPRQLALIDLASPEELSHMLRKVGSAGVGAVVRADAIALDALLGHSLERAPVQIPALLFPAHLCPARLFHVAATQFALLLPPGTDQAELVGRLRGDLAQVRLGRDSLFSTTSTAGIAEIIPGEAPAVELLGRAHAALDHARARRVPIAQYDRACDEAFRRAFTLLNDFAGAVRTGDGLRLVFQPRLDLASARCVGVEALIRWDHPALGAIPPAEFVRLVDRTTMARSLVHWVLDQALLQMSEWRAAGCCLKVSINVSPANLEHDDFASHVLARLAAAHVAPSALELEITECALLDGSGPALQQLRRLSEAGVSIAIDDFGTGYSSLSYLQWLPADVIKIDKSFILGLSQTGADEGRLRTLVAAMIGLSHDLGYRVVAEGIENQDAADVLHRLACDEVQGYHFAHPMPPSAFLQWYGQQPWQAVSGSIRAKRAVGLRGGGAGELPVVRAAEPLESGLVGGSDLAGGSDVAGMAGLSAYDGRAIPRTDQKATA